MPEVPSLSGSVASVFAPGGALAISLDGFEARPAQLEMAAAVADIFDGGGILLAEAGTGTGKTLAYLVPAMLSRKRVLGTLAKGLRPGALIVWLDEVTPPYRKGWPIKWEAMITVSTSGGHRARTLFVYRVLETAHG